MGKRKSLSKLALTRRHRKDWYEKAVNDLIDGKAGVSPEYVHERFKKLKEVR